MQHQDVFFNFFHRHHQCGRVFEGRYYSGLILNRYSLARSDFNLNRHIADSQKPIRLWRFRRHWAKNAV
ncbi:hypothetical protein NEIPOLOT_00722 [Neisseria polysaccharea ATCC 43768]|nr:hypothetical protein NEIPOLOT_00722 [Neisseria polysaccharea ATCC 43768]